MDKSYTCKSLVVWLMMAGLLAAGCALETDDAFDLDIDDVAAESAEIEANATGTSAYRNTSYYDISRSGGAFARLVVMTEPPQPGASVYSWRTHTQHEGPGPYDHYGDLIGTTDANGVLIIQTWVPNEPIYCGEYTNERFAVGSPWAPKSAPLNFQIYRGVDFSPAHPDCIFYE